MGRKKMKTEEKVDIRLRMDAEMAARIQEMADRYGVSVAAFIRAATVEKIERIVREGGK